MFVIGSTSTALGEEPEFQLSCDTATAPTMASEIDFEPSIAVADLRRLVELPYEAKALFGGGLGLVSGVASALAFRQRAGFAMRPREAKKRANLYFLVATLILTALGMFLAGADFVRADRIEEGIAHGVLSALVALSLFLLPVMTLGLDIDEGARACWGLAGALLLAVWTWFLVKGLGDDLLAQTKALLESGAVDLNLDVPEAFKRRKAISLGIDHLQSQMSAMLTAFSSSAVVSYFALRLLLSPKFRRS